jgi:hypothetical protein
MKRKAGVMQTYTQKKVRCSEVLFVDFPDHHAQAETTGPEKVNVEVVFGERNLTENAIGKFRCTSSLFLRRLVLIFAQLSAKI